MNRLGVVTCQVLELELAYLLSHDADVNEIWIIQNNHSANLIDSLKRLNTKPAHEIESVEQFNPSDADGLAVLIDVLKVGLHSHIPSLRNAVRASALRMAPFIESIFLGYGLCGNALDNLDDLFSDVEIPVVIPMDRDGPVDDCVGMIIGGREAYYEEQCRCAGTMFMNAGFSQYVENILVDKIPDRISHLKDKIMHQLMDGYKRSLLLPTPVMDEKQLHQNSKLFNEKYGLTVETRTGTLDIIKNGIQHAKKAIT